MGSIKRSVEANRQYKVHYRYIMRIFTISTYFAFAYSQNRELNVAEMCDVHYPAPTQCTEEIMELRNSTCMFETETKFYKRCECEDFIFMNINIPRCDWQDYDAELLGDPFAVETTAVPTITVVVNPTSPEKNVGPCGPLETPENGEYICDPDFTSCIFQCGEDHVPETEEPLAVLELERSNNNRNFSRIYVSKINMTVVCNLETKKWENVSPRKCIHVRDACGYNMKNFMTLEGVRVTENRAQKKRFSDEIGGTILTLKCTEQDKVFVNTNTNKIKSQCMCYRVEDKYTCARSHNLAIAKCEYSEIMDLQFTIRKLDALVEESQRSLGSNSDVYRQQYHSSAKEKLSDRIRSIQDISDAKKYKLSQIKEGISQVEGENEVIDFTEHPSASYTQRSDEEPAHEPKAPLLGQQSSSVGDFMYDDFNGDDIKIMVKSKQGSRNNTKQGLGTLEDEKQQFSRGLYDETDLEYVYTDYDNGFY